MKASTHAFRFVLLGLTVVLFFATSFAASPVPARAAGNVTLTGKSETNPGNVFTTDEAVSVPLVFANADSTAYALSVAYSVRDWQGLIVDSGSFGLTVAGNADAAHNVTPIVTLKGTYRLEVKAVSASPSFTIAKSFPFSVVAPIDGGVGDGVFGINLHGDQDDKGDSGILIPLAQKAGVQWIRDTIQWNHVEKTKGVYEFADRLDTEVDQAREAGMQVLLVLCYENSLYKDENGSPTPHTEAQYEAFANYARAVATHFAGQVDHFEIWNEWDGGKGNDELYGPSVYTQLLSKAHDAIVQAVPNAVIIGGATRTVNAVFIKGILDNQGYDKMTSVSVHPYTDPTSAETGNPGWYSIPSAVDKVTAQFAGFGPAKKIWMTEFGWPTATVDEAHQAAYAARAFATGMSEIRTTGGVSKMFYYDFQDDGTVQTSKEETWGWLRNWTNTAVPYSAKQSYVAVNAASTLLKGATYAGTTDLDRVRMIKFTRTSDNKDIVMMFELDDVSVPVGIRGATASSMQAYDRFGNPIPMPASLSYSPVYLIGSQGSFHSGDVTTAASTLLGETTIGSGSSTGHSGHLIAEKVTLSDDAIVKSLSMNVKTAAGKLTMGIYSDAGGIPGTLQAVTPEFTPAAGWNTVNVSAEAVLPHGDYWLAYQPSSDALATAFEAAAGTVRYANHSYGALPGSFPASSAMNGTPSLYATFYSPHLIDNAVYTIEPLSSPGLLLNAEGDSAGDPVSLTTSPAWWESDDTMKWQVVYSGQGYWKLSPVSAPGTVLSDEGGTASGTQTQLSSDDGDDSDLWKLKIEGDGIFRLSPKNASGEALDVRGAGTANGTPVQLYDINNTSAQQWRFKPYSIGYAPPLVNDAIYAIEPLNAPGKFLTAEGSGNGSNVDIRASRVAKNAGSDQQWRAVDAGGGYWKLFSVAAPSYDMDLAGGNAANGTNIQIWYDSAADARLFKPADPVNGFYQLVPKPAPNSRMDVSGMGTADGTNVQIWSFNGSANQKWRLNLVSSYNPYH